MSENGYDRRWRLTTAAIGCGALALAGLGLRYSTVPTVIVLPSVLPGALLVGAAIAPRATLPWRGGDRVPAWRILGGTAHSIFWAVLSVFALWLLWESSGWWRVFPGALAAIALSQLFITVRTALRGVTEPNLDDEH